MRIFLSTGLNADAADELPDDILPLKIFQFLKTNQMFKILLPRSDRAHRTGFYAEKTVPAVFFGWPAGRKRHIRQQSRQPELRAKLLANKKIVPAYPAYASPIADFFMREMRLLQIPVNDL